MKLLAEMEKREEAQEAELAYCNSQLEATQRLLVAKDSLLHVRCQFRYSASTSTHFGADPCNCVFCDFVRWDRL